MALLDSEKACIAYSVNAAVKNMQPTMSIRTTALLDIGGEALASEDDKANVATKGDNATSVVATSEMVKLLGGSVKVEPAPEPQAEE